MKNTKTQIDQEQNKFPKNKLLHLLKQAMVDDGIITEERLRDAEVIAKREKEPLSDILEKLDFVKKETLDRFVKSKISIPAVHLSDQQVDQSVLRVVPEKIARRFNIIPLDIVNNVLTVATSNPLDMISFDTLTQTADYTVEVVLASRESIHSAIAHRYGLRADRQELIEEIAEEFQRTHQEKEARVNQYADEINEIRLRREAEEPPIVRLVNCYIAQAMVEGATDIHLEPKKDAMKVRFRIDGYLFNRHELSAKLIGPIVSRIKIMSGLDITVKRFPQNGRIGLKMKEKNIDILTSTFPTINGENVVLRILDKSGGPLHLSEIGLSDENLALFNKMIRNTEGLILATGPTGSGKTTTIYSLLQALEKTDKNIVTIEDPIEHEIEGIVQSQVDDAAGMSYASALDSLLQQDPDILYVGEIRDSQTATLAVRAALTGHLVFSTIQVGQSVEAVSRLLDIGVGEGLIESALNCSFAQRLVRKLCAHCRQEYGPDERLLKDLSLPANTKFFRKKGCEACSGIGYKGRIGLFELLVYDRKIKALISNRAPESEIAAAARANGMRTLFEDGLQKILKGVTTFDEVKNATENN